MRRKITVIGAGNVGTTTAQLIAERDLADVVLFDIIEGIPQGKALDIQEACPLWNSSAKVTGTNTYDETSGSDIAVITAGLPRKPGMSRDDLMKANSEVIRDVAENIARTSPEAIVIVVTNPMDAMTQIAQIVTGFPHRRVIGMGGVLDTARMKTFIAMELGVHPKGVQATVLGGHGDLMVPVRHAATVGGKPLTELLPRTRIEKIVERTKNGGAEIVGLLKAGSAYYAPAASVTEMIEHIFGQKKGTLPCSVYVDGQYGVHGVYIGVPVRLSLQGVEEIIEMDISEEEKQALTASSESVKELVQKAGFRVLKK